MTGSWLEGDQDTAAEVQASQTLASDLVRDRLVVHGFRVRRRLAVSLSASLQATAAQAAAWSWTRSHASRRREVCTVDVVSSCRARRGQVFQVTSIARTVGTPVSTVWLLWIMYPWSEWPSHSAGAGQCHWSAVNGRTHSPSTIGRRQRGSECPGPGRCWATALLELFGVRGEFKQ